MGIGSTGYQIFLLLHLVFVVVAFGGNFVQPMLARSGNVSNEAFGRAVLFIQLPALVLMWVTGMGLAGMSDDAIELTQTWILLAIIVFLVAAALQFVIGRSWRAGDAKLIPALTGGLHLCLVVGLYLMVFQPGRPGG
jgi:quinol-cytochrome oxidoreductase complex cytochrome b subunit